MKNTRNRKILVVAILVTVAVVVLWQATGGDFYTKYQVIEEIAREVDPNDPFAEAGLYDGAAATETVSRDTFRFGLLPTAAGIVDKHALSVVSLAAPTWLVAFGAIWWTRRKQRQSH